MSNFMIVHCKHEGCYDTQIIEDEVAKARITPITINPPKIFTFHDKEKAYDFFNEYINDVDVIDARCKKGDDIEHQNYCTCGIIEFDENDEQPILFYNKKNQIFLLETGAQVFTTPQELKRDINNLNTTYKLIKKCKTLGSKQRQTYIELGEMCKKCEFG